MSTWLGNLNLQRAAFAAVMVFAGLLGDAPQDHPTILAATGAAILALVVGWMGRPTFQASIASFGLLAYLGAIMVSFPVALSFGTGPFDWAFRAAIPMAFIGVFFLVPLETREDTKFVLQAVLAGCASWAALTIWQMAPRYDLLLAHRWTAVANNLIVPFNLAGIAILLFANRVLPKWAHWSLLAILAVLTAGGGYRSHVAVVIVLLATFLALLWPIPALRARVIPVALIAVMSVGSFQMVGLWGQNLTIGAHEEPAPAPKSPEGPSPKPDPAPKPPETFAEKKIEGIPWLRQFFGSRDSARFLEIEYALQQFLDAPILGKGLAYPIPSEIHFKGREDYLARLEAAKGKKYPYVYMMHSFPAAVAMSMGVVGLAAVAVFYVGLLLSLTRQSIADMRDRIAMLAGVLSLSAFSLISAIHLIPQWGLLIGAMSAVVVARQSVPLRAKNASRSMEPAMIAIVRKALLVASVAGVAIAFVLGALVMNRLAAEDGYHDQMLSDWQNQHSR